MKLASLVVSVISTCLVLAGAISPARGDQLDQTKKNLAECKSMLAKCQQELGKFEKLEADAKKQGEDDEKIEASIKENEALKQTLELKIKDACKMVAKLEAEIKAGLNTTKGVSDICPVHHIKMTTDRVPVVYGLMAQLPGEPSPKIIDKDFPFYARKFWAGGCIVGYQKEAIIYVCPECAREEKAWVAAHRAAVKQ